MSFTSSKSIFDGQRFELRAQGTYRRGGNSTCFLLFVVEKTLEPSSAPVKGQNSLHYTLSTFKSFGDQFLNDKNNHIISFLFTGQMFSQNKSSNKGEWQGKPSSVWFH